MPSVGHRGCRARIPAVSPSMLVLATPNAHFLQPYGQGPALGMSDAILCTNWVADVERVTLWGTVSSSGVQRVINIAQSTASEGRWRGLYVEHWPCTVLGRVQALSAGHHSQPCMTGGTTVWRTLKHEVQSACGCCGRIKCRACTLPSTSLVR